MAGSSLIAELLLQALSQLNTSLEEENRQLMMQVKALLSQNQDMLMQALQSKDQFAEEQKGYLYV